MFLGGGGIGGSLDCHDNSWSFVKRFISYRWKKNFSQKPTRLLHLESWSYKLERRMGNPEVHRENGGGGTLGMVRLIINPISTLYSGYLLGKYHIPFYRASWGVKQLGYHPKGTTILPRGFGESNILTCSRLAKISTLPKFNSSPLKSYRAPIGKWCSNHNFFRGELLNFGLWHVPNFGKKQLGGCLNWLGSFPVECCGLGSYELMNFFRIYTEYISYIIIYHISILQGHLILIHTCIPKFF